jgi:hypothetical protein
MSRRSTRRTRVDYQSNEPDSPVHREDSISPVQIQKLSPERERDIWEAFREEHYEGIAHHTECVSTNLLALAIEQLPLSIHRQFTLLRELDQQFHCSLLYVPSFRLL